jgi:Spy/CpxP family protein refolding chaperone
MKDDVPLTQEQVQQIEALYAEMKAQAVPLGKQLIELERQLNAAFADRSITEARLHEMLEAIAETHKQLRYVHLSTHLKSLPLLTPEQVQRYNTLRGYFADDPCSNIPEGHDPEMWKKHNNCP